jgi:alpha-pyrone synthase
LAYIQDIGTANPQKSLTQSEFYEIYASLTDDKVLQRKLRFITNRSAIDQRYCVDPNILGLLDLPLEDKLAKYHQNAIELAEQAVRSNPAFTTHQDKFTHLIFVSCTGLQAPGVEIDLIERLQLTDQIKRYNITFMGCYAALTGLRLAQDICKEEGNTVLLVSVELCTLHFQNRFDDDYLLSNSLFADGAASVVVTSTPQSARLKVKDSLSRLLKASKKEMSWKISPTGFQMTLSSKVPNSIAESITKEPLFHKNTQEVNWLIHPGGKQIIDGIQNVNKLLFKETEVSRKILRKYGNMSSSTILFVMKEYMHGRDKKNEAIACAFGPGLTLEALLLENV